MPATKLKAFLDAYGIRYVSIHHSKAFTAAEVAESAHVNRSDFAKTVIVKIDGVLAMVVLPASRRILLPDLRELLGNEDVRLATEAEFKDAFPEGELGAMPPFGNLFQMPMYVTASLADELETAFNAGPHTEVIKLAFADFDRLVHPFVLDFITT